MTYKHLITPLVYKDLVLRNKVVMAPMNRRRAFDGIPGDAMVQYYRQRAGAGLIITDNTAISSNGAAYLNTPGIYTQAQKDAWEKIVTTVHDEGGKIFIQLVHAGRVGHAAIQNGEPLVAPSAIRVNETILIPDNTYQPMTEPLAIDTDSIPYWAAKYKQAAINAIEVGFDGVEIHAAHGFLIDQFINPCSNARTDHYGGSIENRARFLVEVMEAVVTAIGKDKTGIRLSPFREIYDLQNYSGQVETHQYILDVLQRLGVLYIHYSNGWINGQPTIPVEYLHAVRTRFSNLLMIAGGFDPASAEAILESGLVDLVAFGKLYISNPDLVERILQDAALSPWEEESFYRGGDNGYTDYRTHARIGS